MSNFKNNTALKGLKLKSGSILAIPLLKGLGNAWAKYIDLTIVNKDVVFPDIIKVYNVRTDHDLPVNTIYTHNYLLSPIAVLGLRHAIKIGIWKVAGDAALVPEDMELPSFKGGNSTYDEIAKGEWFLHEHCTTNNPAKVSYEKVKYMQPFAAIGTANIELTLTMHHIINEGLDVNDFFNLNDDRYKWRYQQVLDSPSLLR